MHPKQLGYREQTGKMARASGQMTPSFSLHSQQQVALSEQERLTDTQHAAGSAEPSLDASDPPGQLHVLGEEGDSASV